MVTRPQIGTGQWKIPALRRPAGQETFPGWRTNSAGVAPFANGREAHDAYYEFLMENKEGLLTPRSISERKSDPFLAVWAIVDTDGERNLPKPVRLNISLPERTSSSALMSKPALTHDPFGFLAKAAQAALKK
jgi:hypothetical protein